MKRLVKILSFVTLIMCIVLLFVACFSSDNDTNTNNTVQSNNTSNPTDDIDYDNFEYKVIDHNQTCVITGLKNRDIKKLVVPQKIEQYIVTAIADNAFQLCGVEEVILPSTLTKIGNGAFSQCFYLVSISLPDNVNQIGESAFYKCSSLEIINIPNSITTISKNMFYGCSSLRIVSLGDNVNSIEEYAFHQCQLLEEIVFPSTLKYIGEGAFMGCNSLTKIVLPKGLIEIDYSAFSVCTSLTEIYLSSSVYLLSIPFTMECPSLISFVVDSKNVDLCSIDGVLYNKQLNLLIAYPSGKQDQEWTIPNTVVEIFNAAFVSNRYIQTINIPKSIKFIGPAIFADCDNLKTINYEGTISMWNAISKHNSWNEQSPNFIVYCTDGQIAKDGTVTYN